MKPIPQGREFEAWIRGQAPAPPEWVEADRDALWRVLHARSRPRRPSRLAMAGLMASLLLLAANPIEVGSDAKKPMSIEQDSSGTAYRSRSGTSITGLQHFAEGPTREQAFEVMLEADLTRSAPISRVYGFRLRGRQSWNVTYAPDREGKAYKVAMGPVFPANEDPPGELDFIQKHCVEFMRQAASGTARDAGVTYVFVDGRPVVLRRWVSSFPGYGLVTYYDGKPVF